MSKQFRRVGPKRPIEKQAIVQFAVAIGTTQQLNTLHTAIVAETLVRIIGNISFNQGANAGFGGCVLVHNRDGQAISTMSLADGVAIYQPEQDILWAKVFSTESTQVFNFDIDVKAMRKLKEGDILSLILLANGADVFDFISQMSMFFKQ